MWGANLDRVYDGKFVQEHVCNPGCKCFDEVGVVAVLDETLNTRDHGDIVKGVSERIRCCRAPNTIDVAIEVHDDPLIGSVLLLKHTHPPERIDPPNTDHVHSLGGVAVAVSVCVL